ncbi:ABC transporter related protein [Desulforamulus reducens MI-1]|uniref:ABC transporter related protein n=1 Tax=Desulforamulus reducens (strain ATCC BAA-1160 / DSM 100696 / MI-1) TaxID=349161 RepID=A4J7X9_DESRM|nr:energy-coupling factor transporter ATPase [Desulforamulus reducens]ABO51182.1 ABC transporter related protein [Desulforamulus reducens MI-1]
MAIFTIKNLMYCYPDSQQPALDQINLNIEEGEFVLVLGGSGSGKSSLARALAGLIPRFYGGRFGGQLTYRNQSIPQMEPGQMAREVGIVFQDPEKQLVMTNVEAELAFGLENLGMPEEEMGWRMAEVMDFLNLSSLTHKAVQQLSGGEKQRLVLGAVLAMRPRVLILDEPTSQLDPVAAEEILAFLRRLNEEMGMTIILVEQRLERCFHLADRVLYMEKGQVRFNDPPDRMAEWAVERGVPFLPPVATFFARIGIKPLPITIAAGRKFMGQFMDRQKELSGQEGVRRGLSRTTEQRKISGPILSETVHRTDQEPRREPSVSLDRLWYAYPDGHEAVKDLSLKIFPGELLVILGANGAGKSTLLKLIAGLLKPGRGCITVVDKGHKKHGLVGRPGRLAYLAQNPNDYLLQDTVQEEIAFSLKQYGLPDDGIVEQLLQGFHLDEYRHCHPRDLSGGQRQRVALASVLVTRPDLLLLDEPTRGMDVRLKEELTMRLREYTQGGAAVIMITHDIEFAARTASHVAVLHRGRLVRKGSTLDVMGNGIFYTTQLGRLSQGFTNPLLTVEEALARWELLRSKGRGIISGRRKTV